MLLLFWILGHVVQFKLCQCIRWLFGFVLDFTMVYCTLMGYNIRKVNAGFAKIPSASTV